MHEITSIKMLAATVTPPEPDLEFPPTTDAGEITEVKTDYVSETALERDKKACQACHDPVCIAKPHVRATVWIDSPVGERMKRPVFCDRECWADWARR